MSAVPNSQPGGDGWDDEWDDEWDDWGALDLIERADRGDRSWYNLLGRFMAVALLLPVVLVALVAALIWIF